MIQKNNYIKLSGNKLPLIIQYLKLYISEIYKYIMRITHCISQKYYLLKFYQI